MLPAHPPALHHKLRAFALSPSPGSELPLRSISSPVGEPSLRSVSPLSSEPPRPRYGSDLRGLLAFPRSPALLRMLQKPRPYYVVPTFCRNEPTRGGDRRSPPHTVPMPKTRFCLGATSHPKKNPPHSGDVKKCSVSDIPAEVLRPPCPIHKQVYLNDCKSPKKRIKLLRGQALRR